MIRESRAKLLQAIGDPQDLTFLRGLGNIGDQLIWAGTRQLLRSLRYREAPLSQIASLTGDTALICGSGGWCEPYHDMPAYLPLVEERFTRVIILPSSFDASVDCVRLALAGSRAKVFAREDVSYRQIRKLCDAELALDCAFFFDFSPYMRTGEGVLRAFRSDREGTGLARAEASIDISVTCQSLDEWLWTIARHQEVHTDRAHVMIAGCLLGKQVRYAPSAYHKLPAIAEYALRSFPVQRLETHTDTSLPIVDTALREVPDARSADPVVVREDLMARAAQNAHLLPQTCRSDGQPVVTVVMLSYGRIDKTIAAVRSILEHVRIPFRLLLVDNGSGAEAQHRLQELASGDNRIDLILLESNLGCAAGRMFGVDRVQTEYVLLIDNDIEVLPGAVEHLVLGLESRSDAIGATGLIVFPNGKVHLCGGRFVHRADTVQPELTGIGVHYLDFDACSGDCDWVPGGFALIRTEVLRKHPYDPQLGSYFEDVEWCHRVRGEGSFLRVRESVAIHDHNPRQPGTCLPDTERVAAAMPYLEAIAYLYCERRIWIPPVFEFVPELGPPSPLSESAARLFLELLHSRGREWTATAWLNGELAPLFQAAAGLRASAEKQMEAAALQQALEKQCEKVSTLVDMYAERQRAVEALAAQLKEQTERINKSMPWYGWAQAVVRKSLSTIQSLKSRIA